MNFIHLSYWPILLVLFILFLITVIRMENSFFNFIKMYWFYKRSILSYLASLLLILGVAGLLFSLLDIRGPEEKIKTEIPKDRTIILIDTSASMLAEDVKPNRLQKATLIAKHFARKAAGHQISIVAFAEIQKKIVPFTSDLDLIDARLDSIEGLRNQYGSSALSVAIQESIQYFREGDGEGEARGHLLVLTDGEETTEGIDLKVPKGIHVALVGVGTSRGGRIPIDDGRGLRFGYKKNGSRDVITKLNEKFFQVLVSDLPSAKYWLANSYSLPSEEILSFFTSEKAKGNTQEDMVIKPVLMEWIVIPSLLLLIFSYTLKSIKIFTLGLLLIILPAGAQANPPELTPEMIERLDELQAGKLDQLEKIKLADDLYQAGAKPEALSLYQENLPPRIDKSLPPEAYLNYGTALLEKGKIQEALKTYKDLNDSLQESPQREKIQDVMDKNIVSYFQQQEQKKKEQKNKDQQKNQDKQDKDSQSEEGSPKDQQGKSEQNQKNKKQEKGQEQDQKKNDSQDGEDKKDDPSQDEGEEKDDMDAREGEKEEKKMPPQKIPAKLKQLMSDDRQLQMKMIEQGTRELNRRKSRKSKDW